MMLQWDSATKKNRERFEFGESFNKNNNNNNDDGDNGNRPQNFFYQACYDNTQRMNYNYNKYICINMICLCVWYFNVTHSVSQSVSQSTAAAVAHFKHSLLAQNCAFFPFILETRRTDAFTYNNHFPLFWSSFVKLTQFPVKISDKFCFLHWCQNSFTWSKKFIIHSIIHLNYHRKFKFQIHNS